ncbi:MAG TPA: translation initiation factor IF-2 [Bacteroidia bacterium]|nr:translation initiation factor IF-2 [Bacteroidia bacterium]HQF27843.1 translation initiation factor IF-2 [Bacteroidia bacterium]
MAEDKAIRLSKVAKEFNVGLTHVVEFLESKGVKVDSNPNAKVSQEIYSLLQDKYQPDRLAKLDAQEVTREKLKRDNIVIEAKPGQGEVKKVDADQDNDDSLKKSLDEIKMSASAPVEKKPAAKAKKVEEKPEEPEVIKAKAGVESPKILGKIDLDAGKKKGKKKEETPAVEPAAPVAETPVAAAPSAPAVEEVPAPKKPVAKAKKAEDEAPKAAPVEPVAEKPAAPKAKPEEPKAKPAEPVAEKPAPAAPKAEEKKAPVVEKPAAPVAEKPKSDDVPPPTPPPADAAPSGPEHIGIRVDKLSGPNIIGKIQLPVDPPKKKPVASSSDFEGGQRKRKRKDKPGGNPQGGNNQGGQNRGPGQGQGQGGQNRGPGQGGQNRGPGQGGPNRGPGGPNRGPGQGGPNRGPGGPNRGPGGPGGNRRPGGPNQGPKVEPTEKEIQDQIKATLARLSGTGKSKASKFRKEKRDLHAKRQEQMDDQSAEKIIKVTEFVSANELAKMMNVQVNQIIATCMSLGLFVSINQRLDAETISVVAEEFGYTVEFVSADVQEAISDDVDDPNDLTSRAPIVTVMGHVDHGKTSLLDYIRKANVIAGEAGGITQHIGAYEVKLEDGRKITFLDTPGHEAFTAMRARGAKVTDVAIIVVSADDSVMPQTREAINHAQAAGVPIVFAINKIDKPDANPEKIKEQLAAMNLLVEDWGGKYQSQDISAKKGLNVDKLLDRVLLEAELLDLKANPERLAKGTVIESSLDKGRGYVTTILVQNGTLKIGDVVLAGCYSGRVKAMFNERGARITEAGPSAPAMILGMSGAPQAGDQFNVMEDEREAREIANKRLQLQREQGIRTHKHITLDEIGRRLAVGNFKELNVIVKGDVDGSVEALADSLLKLSNQEIQVNVIMKGVGQISESDVNLASASNAIIIGFQVRPSVSARKLAENEQIDIRLYSIIYDAINEVKAAMEGMLAPEFEEKIICNVQVREVFKIPKVGTIAGCMVLEGKISRNTKIRVIRDGIVVHSGELASLKRFKDDAKDVQAGMECGLNINNFNDIREGDVVEGYENVAVKRTLA